MTSNHLKPDHETNYFIKILIPAICGGAVIGKGGEALIKAQSESGTKVKVSKLNEYYPGTNERVCLIQGDIDGICKMVEYVSQCISDTRVEPSHLDRHKQTRILIPNTSAGLLIGKEGENINEIKKLSGAYIQVSPKSNNRELVERHVFISGEVDQRRNATRMILDKVIQDPKLCFFPHVNYGEMSMSNSFGGQYGMNVSSPTFTSIVYDNSPHQYAAPEFASDSKSRNVNSSQATMSCYGDHCHSMSLNTTVLGNILSQNKIPSTTSSNTNLMEIAHALQILAQNGCLCQSSIADNRNQNYYPSNSYTTNTRPFTSSFQQLDLMASDSIHGITRTLEVDEAFIGSIIGPKGKSIVELQEITDTNIKVSKKHAESMDIHNKRTITINGMYESVCRAYLLINDKIQLERAKREVSSIETNLSES